MRMRASAGCKRTKGEVEHYKETLSRSGDPRGWMRQEGGKGEGGGGGGGGMEEEACIQGLFCCWFCRVTAFDLADIFS